MDFWPYYSKTEDRQFPVDYKKDDSVLKGKTQFRNTWTFHFSAYYFEQLPVKLLYNMSFYIYIMYLGRLLRLANDELLKIGGGGNLYSCRYSS